MVTRCSTVHACRQDHLGCSSTWSGSREAATLLGRASQYNNGQACLTRMLATHVIVEQILLDVLQCEICLAHRQQGLVATAAELEYTLHGARRAYRRAWMPAGGRSVGEVVAGVVGPARPWREQCTLCTSGSSPHLPQPDTITVIPAPRVASCVVGLLLTDII